MKHIVCHCIFILLLGLSACDEQSSQADSSQVEYRTIDWIELIPADDLEALLNPPEDLNMIADGSNLDQLDSDLKYSISEPQNRYEQALVSTKVNDNFDQQRIRVPGFIVPLEFDDNNVVTTFFLVPFFGACIHEPPPPPNQIIYSYFEPGKKVDDIEEAVWITGTMTTSITEDDLATSAYSMIVDSINPYYSENP